MIGDRYLFWWRATSFYIILDMSCKHGTRFGVEPPSASGSKHGTSSPYSNWSSSHILLEMVLEELSLDKLN